MVESRDMCFGVCIVCAAGMKDDGGDDTITQQWRMWSRMKEGGGVKKQVYNSPGLFCG